MTKPIPDGFRTITPHLTVKNCGEAIEFYKNAFAAEELARMPGPDGQSVMYANLKIGDSMIMMNDEFPGTDGPQSPSALGATTTTIHLYVENVDAAYDRAVEAGAKGTMAPMDAFWGDRYGRVTDPYGHQWAIASRKEDLSPEEIMANAAKLFGGGGGDCHGE